MKLRLRINSKKEVEKFYRMLPIYRSVLCKFIYFKLDEDKYGISDIVKALNIKNREKRITFIYDYVCSYIDNKYSCNINMCGFKDGKCYQQRGTNKCNGCCRGCKYQSNKGCTTSNLTCKFYFCSDVRDRYDVIELEDIDILKCFGLRQRIIIKHNYFVNREDYIKDLYYESLIVVGVRICYRLIRNYIYLKRNKML